MNHHKIALVAARPGRLRDGWRALLLAMGPIEAVSLADDSLTAMRMVKALAPDLVLLDVEALANEAWTLLAQIKIERPGCRLIALVRDAHQLVEPRLAAADAALVKGFPAAALFEAVRRLLPE